MVLPPYPAEGVERDRWIAERRSARNAVEPRVPYAFLVEDECAATGVLEPTATVFLTNRECPWRCVMCDLWQNTLTESVPAGAIPEQIRYALGRLPPAKHIKLYNSGSFFDRGAIPVEDYSEIASAVEPFERVIVESHPSLVGDRCWRFRDLVRGELEVAMGLETAHAQILERLNKKLTLAQFATAAERLREERVDLRVFVLIQPPFMKADEALFWAKASVDFAFECGATAVALIPTRAGNGAVDALALIGEFQVPELHVAEAVFTYGLGLRSGRVFLDLWDIERVPSCAACRLPRLDRLRAMNLSQQILPAISCVQCGGSGE